MTTPTEQSWSMQEEMDSDLATPPLQLLGLPADALSCIHAFLPASDLLCGLLASSRALHDFLIDDAQLWQGMCQRRFGVPASMEGVEAVAVDAEDEGPDSWFRPSSDESASISSSSSSSTADAQLAGSSSASSLSSTCPLLSASSNRWLILYRSFSLTSPRPLQLQVLFVDDEGYTPSADALAHSSRPDLARERARRAYSTHNILKIRSNAYCSARNKNIHVILALARTTEQQEQDAATTTASIQTASSAATAGPSQSPSVATATGSSQLDSSSTCPPSQPLPSSFLLSEFVIDAPEPDDYPVSYTSPLSSGLLFFSATLPTPAQISAWDDWSEAQWKEREERSRVNGMSAVAAEEVARGEGNSSDSKEQKEEPRVANWFANGPAAMDSSAAPAVLRAFPLRFESDTAPGASSDDLDESDNLGPQPVLAPLAAFFHIETNGSITLDSAPVPLPTQSSMDDDAVATLSGGSASASAPSAASASASSSDAASTAASATAAAAASVLAQPLPYTYRHRFARPVYGRFLVLTFLRSSGAKDNIDVSFFGVKGFQKGMASAPLASAAAQPQPQPPLLQLGVSGSISANVASTGALDHAVSMYHVQVQQLVAMGFTDTWLNLQALIRTNGNVAAAVERLEAYARQIDRMM